ncbi:energy transducer TonB family protein [Parvularcula lutaonensis]|uniref:Energy transducer TonB n=1 Tax=Parvularcula lutaonensis TaxID=491923 RepID=A0ABV7M811_9PROT|nr:energy transducer TonB [Parvularcula lutaonensis]GGY42710.1 protein TonB [Parvularcula lutaonensis]
MGGLIRTVIGVPVAGVVVLGLFLLMWAQIRPKDVPLEEDKEPIKITITNQIEDSELVNQRRFERPKLDAPPPPPPAIERQNFEPQVDGVRAAAPDFGADVDIGSGFNPDRDAQPLVRVNPTGFERCIDSDVGEERVRLRFDVDPNGNVVNVQVLDSTDRCYDRYAVRAAQRWKYQPKVLKGEQVPRRGVETTIVFSIGAE